MTAAIVYASTLIASLAFGTARLMTHPWPTTGQRVAAVANDGAVRWERVELGYRGQLTAGYFGERRLDVYDATGIRLSDADLALLRGQGVAVGLDTNVGRVWAQKPGENFTVVREP